MISAGIFAHGMQAADGPRLPAFDLLSKHHIREGLKLMEDALNGDRWGGDVIPTCLGYFLRYGTHAKESLPRLKNLEMIEKRWGPQVEAVENSTESPTLVSLQEFILKAAKPEGTQAP